MDNNDFINSLAADLAVRRSGGQSLEAALNTLRNVYNVAEEDVERARFVFETKASTTRYEGFPPVIIGTRTRASSWYAGSQEGDLHWPLVNQRLLERLPEDAVASIDLSSNKILSVMDAPGEQRFSTRGLVLGYVQSGKTTSFISVVSKAADRGYRFFIVLSGLTDNLRTQTQDRVDELLIGEEAGPWYQLTNMDTDFHESTTNASSLLSTPDLRFISVVKKNPSRLRRLRDWLKSAGPATLANTPILIIDDEADQASLNGAAPNRRRTVINGLIAELLENPKSAYVAYTATPFANLLTDPSDSKNLYPEDFIVPLPQPEQYFGPEQLFGRLELDTETSGDIDGLDVIRFIDDQEALSMLPGKGQGAVYDWFPEVQEDLSKALMWFLLSTAARRARGIGNKHSTMLIHTSMLAEAHRRLADAVEEELEKYSVLIDTNDSKFLALLRNLWNVETAKIASGVFGHPKITWEQVLLELPQVTHATKIIVDNYRSQDRLSYSKEEPVTAVVIGGNTLSRGLTLEGLCSSYFVRAATAYDTLLQMGRWFGYRIGYEDLCRIWMTSELHKWFRDLSLVEAEIRRDISRYEEELVTPRDVAVRIRNHPDMAITAAARMRSAINSSMSFSRQRPQTTLFEINESSWLDKNLEATRKLISGAKTAGRDEKVFESGYRGFSNVDSTEILKFIDEYQFHSKKWSLSSELLRKYIELENKANSLLRWNIIFKESRGSEVSSNPKLDLGLSSHVSLLRRTKLIDSEPGTANLKAIASPNDRGLDLDYSSSKLQEILAKSQQDADANIVKIKQVEMPTTGLLCLYPIDKDSITRSEKEKLRANLDSPQHIIAATFFFPAARNSHSEVGYMSANLSSFKIENPEDEFADIAAADEADVSKMESETNKNA